MGERIGSNSGVNGAGGAEVEDQVDVLPGFRFHPTDEELVDFYLRRKVQQKHLSLDIIKEIDIYKYDPWELPRAGALGEKEWYFFCLRGRKYRNSIRPNRVTGSGFWKATGIDRPIHSLRNPGECVGLKKSLVYYQGSAGKGTKTDWMMHEYRLSSSPDCIQAEVWTVCRIIKRSASLKRYRQQHQFEQLSSKEAIERFDSSSKSNSLESDWVEENKKLDLDCYGFQHEESFGGDCLEEEIVQLCGYGDWTTDEHVSSSTWCPDSDKADEIISKGSWDEIGRMVDYMMETATSYDIAYYC